MSFLILDAGEIRKELAFELLTRKVGNWIEKALEERI